MESPGKVRGYYVGVIDGECTRLSEAISNPDSSVALIVPGLEGRGWAGAFGKFLLNLSTIVADSVMYLWYMYPCFANAIHPNSWWSLSRGELSGLLKWYPRHDLLKCTIVAM